MAFIKETTLKGILIPSAYYKITSTKTDEAWEDELGKIYTVTVFVNSYTNDTKEFDIEQRNYYLEWFREAELSLTNIYTRLISEIPEFEWVINI